MSSFLPRQQHGATLLLFALICVCLSATSCHGIKGTSRSRSVSGGGGGGIRNRRASTGVSDDGNRRRYLKKCKKAKDSSGKAKKGEADEGLDGKKGDGKKDDGRLLQSNGVDEDFDDDEDEDEETEVAEPDTLMVPDESAKPGNGPPEPGMVLDESAKPGKGPPEPGMVPDESAKPGTGPDDGDGDGDGEESDRVSDVSAQPGMTSDVDWCPDSDFRSADCDALGRGDTPKGERNVTGVMDIEVTYENKVSDWVRKQIERILKSETGPKLAGCDTRKRRKQRTLAEDDEADYTVVSVDDLDSYQILGAQFGEMAVADNLKCKEKDGAQVCTSHVGGEVVVFYDSGEKNLTKNEQLEIMEDLEETIMFQMESGDFEEIGEVDEVDVRLAGSGGGLSAALMGSIAALAVICLGCGGYYYYKTKNGEKPDFGSLFKRDNVPQMN